VAAALCNLALLYDSQGKYDEAEPLYIRSLAIREKALGPEHPDIAGSLNNLAELYRSLGKYDEAEPFYIRSLAILEKALGPEHPHVATALNNLALLYYSLKKYYKAELLYKRSLAISEKVLGPEHPNVEIIRNNLALLYKSQNKNDKEKVPYKHSGMENIENQLKEIIEKRLLKAPQEAKKSFPSVLQSSQVNWTFSDTERFFLLIFFDMAGLKRMKELSNKGYHPFPGFINEKDDPTPSAFRFEKSRNTFIKSCSVENSYALSLGKDSTVIICDLHQSLTTPELGHYQYIVDLAYIISYGDEINRGNLLEHLDSLIAYSIYEWRYKA
jgi:tetratricopeptide (TPR) repeat protein